MVCFSVRTPLGTVGMDGRGRWQWETSCVSQPHGSWDKAAGSRGASGGQILEHSAHGDLGLASRLDSGKGERENSREMLQFLARTSEWAVGC